VSSGGTILRTADGSATWAPQSSGTIEDFGGVAFADASAGIAMGTNGTIRARPIGVIPHRRRMSPCEHLVWFPRGRDGLRPRNRVDEDGIYELRVGQRGEVSRPGYRRHACISNCLVEALDRRREGRR
jgi:hypothetical protein